MPTTLTLKGIPDEIHAALRASATAHRRSLNSEAVACLEAVLLPRKLSATEHARQAREMREVLRGQSFDPAEMDAIRREGRA